MYIVLLFPDATYSVEKIQDKDKYPSSYNVFQGTYEECCKYANIEP